AFLDAGLAIATRLVVDHCGGTASAITRAGTPPTAPHVVADYRPEMVEALAGVPVSPERQRDILTALGFTVAETDSWAVTVPSWRRDVHGTADLVEEVVRIEGLD